LILVDQVEEALAHLAQRIAQPEVELEPSLV
jgi:hypothetical protein